MAEPHDEFYTGYLPDAPDGIARHVRRVVGLLLLISVAAASVVAISQRPFDVSFFEFGNAKTFTGTVSLDPYPMLVVDRPNSQATSDVAAHSRYYVVAFGKSGAQESLQAFDGQRVQLEGTLIYRDDQTMLELVDGTVEAVDANKTADGLDAAASSAPLSESLGEFTLRGEIVDSKCYLGVMKPGHHKPHRACASLCLRGGIPPLFVPYAETATSELPSHFLLVGLERQAIGEQLLDWVAEPVEITGNIQRLDDVWMLQADIASIRRLAELEK